MLADRSDTLVRIDARLAALRVMRDDARAKDCAAVAEMLRKRIDTVLDSRLAATRR